MDEQLRDHWRAAGITVPRVVCGVEAQQWIDGWAAYPADAAHALVVRVSILPSKLAEFINGVRRDFPECSILAHAGDGLVWLAFQKFPSKGLSHAVVRELGPRAIAAGGHAVVVANPSGAEMTHQAVWGGASNAFRIMSEVKRAWDPLDRLNPGRFVYQ
jgi:FAD/FMN-containing dehydrogenase